MLKVLLIWVAAGVPAAMAQGTSPTPIRHVIVIMQENRSFDHYFGTFPGANTIPQDTCVPLNPAKLKKGCVPPFHDVHDVNFGARHRASDAQFDLDDGITTAKMDGFVFDQMKSSHGLAEQDDGPDISPHGDTSPGPARHDVMGYHTAAELPNYWAYAQHFVLQDAMFESIRGYSLASHLGLASEWSASCSDATNVATCVTDPYNPHSTGDTKVKYPWVNLFQLMDVQNVSWKYYLGTGTEPDCNDGDMTCPPQIAVSGVPTTLWNPAEGFAWVRAQGPEYLAAHTPKLDRFLADLNNGALPQLSWLVPAGAYSEHPDNGVTAGMEYVTSVVNAIMQSRYWTDTAIFISWDDWGGFYDHVVPPIVDYNSTMTPVEGYGLRVPGIMISAYARAGFVDNGVMSHDAYATLVEDLFMHGSRLNPTQLGEPDSRPTIRDALTSVTYPDGSTAPIGRLIDEFNFAQAPLPPLILSTHIPVAIQIACGSIIKHNPQVCTSSNVFVSWDSVAGGAVPGPFTYQVLRDGVALPSCSTTGTSCLDVGVPSGAHYYTAYSIDSTHTASPPCAAAEADVP